MIDIYRREVIVSVFTIVPLSGCFAPGGPTQRTLSLENVSIQQEEDGFLISGRTYFSVRNLDPNEAFHDISVVGYTTENKVVCHHSIGLGGELSKKIQKEVSFTCSQLPDYLTIAINEESCESTFFSKHRITQSGSNYTVEYVGDRRCDDAITTIPE